MTGLISALLNAEPRRQLFARGKTWITAGNIRAMAAYALPRLANGPVFLNTTSASCFVAGLLAAAASAKTIALPAHTQPGYLEEIGCSEATLTTDKAFGPGGEDGAIAVSDHDPVLRFFTSGSTSTPKQVEKSLSRLEIEVRAHDSVWGPQAGHVVATVSHQHIYGMLFRIVGPLLSNRTADDSAATYWEDLEGRLAGATLVSSPAHLTRLPPRADLLTPPPTLIFSSGQLLPADAAQDCVKAFGKAVTEVLGSTETGGIAWRRQTTPDSPWTPLPGVTVARGDDGAMIVRSPFLQTDAPQQTGDTIDLEPNGQFSLKARGDRVAKIDGKRVSLTRVEGALAALPDVESVAAFTLPARKDALAAIVVLTAQGREN